MKAPVIYAAAIAVAGLLGAFGGAAGLAFGLLIVAFTCVVVELSDPKRIARHCRCQAPRWTPDDHGRWLIAFTERGKTFYALAAGDTIEEAWSRFSDDYYSAWPIVDFDYVPEVGPHLVAWRRLSDLDDLGVSLEAAAS